MTILNTTPYPEHAKLLETVVAAAEVAELKDQHATGQVLHVEAPSLEKAPEIHKAPAPDDPGFDL